MIQQLSLPVVPHLEQLIHELREIAGALELVQVVLEPEPREPVYPALLIQNLHEGPLLELRQLLHGDRLVLRVLIIKSLGLKLKVLLTMIVTAKKFTITFYSLKRNLNTKSKKMEKEKAKKVKHLTHINLKGFTKGITKGIIKQGKSNIL